MKKINFGLNSKLWFRYLKKLLALWLCIAIVVGVLMSAVTIIFSQRKSSVSAVVNLSFDGIEQGLDPLGNKFSPYDIKSTSIIKSACEEVGIDSSDEMAAKIATDISIDGVVPSDIINKITKYSSLFEGESLKTSENIDDTSYYPTEYNISIKYKNAGLNRKQAALLVNAMTEKYKEHFYKTYGYNESIEKAVLAVDYNDYDYSESVDVLNSYLDTLKTYIDQLSEEDNSRFISKKTGYSFSDLSKAIDTLKSEDLDWILSYIIANNVTKNKNDLISYYEYKIEDLSRTKDSYQDQLDEVKKLTSEYKKTNTVVLGVGDDSKEYEYSQSSETYDNLVNLKVEYQTDVSDTQSKIDLYKERISKLSTSSKKGGDNKQVEKSLSNIFEKIETLLQNVNDTATEYYDDVKLADAYEVLVPANGSMRSYVVNTIKSHNEIFAVQLILLGLYIFAALVLAIMETNGKVTDIKFTFKKMVKSKDSKKSREK